jgi:hypothetical protein
LFCSTKKHLQIAQFYVDIGGLNKIIRSVTCIVYRVSILKRKPLRRLVRLKMVMKIMQIDFDVEAPIFITKKTNEHSFGTCKQYCRSGSALFWEVGSGPRSASKWKAGSRIRIEMKNRIRIRIK